MAVKPDAITLYDIVESVEGSIAPVACVDDESCDRWDKCVTRSVWQRVKEAMKNELQGQTLAELANEQEKLYHREQMG